MSNKNGCVYTLLILLLSYEVSTQNYYHTIDTEREGNYDFKLNKPKTEPPYGIYGNLTPQRTIPNALYNYPATYKPYIQEVPVKVVNVPPIYDNKDPKNNLTPKIDAYIVANKSNDSYNDNVKLATKDNDEILHKKNVQDYNQEVSNKDIKDKKQEDIVKKETLDSIRVGNETTSDIVNNRKEEKNSDNVIPTEIENIGKQFEKITNLNRNLSKPKTDAKVLEKVEKHAKKIEIALPESDTTTIIISSRNEERPSNYTKEAINKQNSNLESQQISNAKQNRRNLTPNDKAIEFHKHKPVDLALNRKIWPIGYRPLTYTVNSRKVNSPFYYLYPNKFSRV